MSRIQRSRERRFDEAPPTKECAGINGMLWNGGPRITLEADHSDAVLHGLDSRRIRTPEGALDELAGRLRKLKLRVEGMALFPSR